MTTQRSSSRGSDSLAELRHGVTSPAKADTCAWSQVDEDYDSYATGCGHHWEFNAGGPAENKQQFCGYCGKRIEVTSPAKET